MFSSSSAVAWWPVCCARARVCAFARFCMFARFCVFARSSRNSLKPLSKGKTVSLTSTKFTEARPFGKRSSRQ
eukprot:12487533-Prorocentrum_lima.AAC.1